MSTTVTKAIISVAGWGTRRLPITKAVDKCMLPVGNRPIVDYVVRDCIKAGIHDIIFVVNKGSTQLQQYYGENERLNEYLTYNQKGDLMELAHPPAGINFTFIEQDSNDKYGTAIPVALAYKHIQKGETVAVLGGDDFIYNADGSDELTRQIAATPQGGSSMLTTTVPMEQISRYGVVHFDEQTGAFVGIVEKPQPEVAPSNQINVSKYILNYDMLTRIHGYGQLDVTGEFYIIEPICMAVVEGQVMTVVPAQGEYMDCGNVHGWLHANNTLVNRMA